MSVLNIRGKVHKFGDNINTDIITPGKYLELSIEEMAKHVMEGIEDNFASKINPGDIIVAGTNFGSGSSRETAPLALKIAGISTIIAKSYARIFYRNSFNIGLPVLEIRETDEIEEGNILEVNLETGTVNNLTKNKIYNFLPLPVRLLNMIKVGGLVAQLEQEDK